MTCPKDAHTHYIGLQPMLFQGWAVVDDTRVLGILTDDKRVAERVAELINRHGLVDVPDNAAGLAPNWGPPSGRARVLLADIQKLPADPTKESR